MSEQKDLALLYWIAEQEFAQYGECPGKTLDGLIASGLVQIHGSQEAQSAFIAKGPGLMYRAVSLTDAGHARLNAAETEMTPATPERLDSQTETKEQP